MKQVLIYVSLVILAIAAVVIIKLNEKPMADKAITISQYYSVMDPFQGIDIPIYLTNDNHLLTNVDSYQFLYLVNDDDSKKIAVTLSNISVDGAELYLSENYTRYMLEIELPVLTDDFFMSICYLDITLVNGYNYSFEIGSFSYIDVTDTVDYMFWTTLEALKDENVHIARIKEIAVSFDTLTHTIEHVTIGLNQDVSFEVIDGLLTIDIMYQDYLLYGCPMMITYDDQRRQVIAYFNYLKENAILQSSGVLNHVYDVSITA